MTSIPLLRGFDTTALIHQQQIGMEVDGQIDYLRFSRAQAGEHVGRSVAADF